MLTAFSLPSCPSALLDFIALEYRSKCGGHEGAITYAAAELAKGGPMGASALVSFTYAPLVERPALSACISRVVRFERANINPRRECWFIVDTKWLQSWAKFVRGEGPPPGRISNEGVRVEGGGAAKRPSTGRRAICVCPPPSCRGNMFEFRGDGMHVQAVVNQHVFCFLHPNARCSLRVMSRYFAGAMRRDSRPTSSAYFVHRQSRFVAVAERDPHIATPRTAPSDFLAGRASYFLSSRTCCLLSGRKGWLFSVLFPADRRLQACCFVLPTPPHTGNKEA